MNGNMIWFNPDKRHGFIRTEEGERLLVETTGLAADCVMPTRCRGLAVSFDREDSPEAPRAVGVAMLPLMAPRRARRRGNR